MFHVTPHPARLTPRHPLPQGEREGSADLSPVQIRRSFRRLEEEKAALAGDIREVYSEAKGSGFDTKIMRQVVRMRKLDKADFQEQEAILDLYLNALGMR